MNGTTGASLLHPAWRLTAVGSDPHRARLRNRRHTASRLQFHGCEDQCQELKLRRASRTVARRVFGASGSSGISWHDRTAQGWSSSHGLVSCRPPARAGRFILLQSISKKRISRAALTPVADAAAISCLRISASLASTGRSLLGSKKSGSSGIGWRPNLWTKALNRWLATLSKEHLTQGLRGVQESLTERELERFALVPKFFKGSLNSKKCQKHIINCE